MKYSSQIAALGINTFGGDVNNNLSETDLAMMPDGCVVVIMVMKGNQCLVRPLGGSDHIEVSADELIQIKGDPSVFLP